MGVPIGDGFTLGQGKHLDTRRDKDGVKYTTTLDVINSLPIAQRFSGQTLNLIDPNDSEKVIEYWFQGGVNEEHLIPKGTNISTPIPEDFFFSGTYNVVDNRSNEMLYRTDIDRYIDLRSYTGNAEIWSINWVGQLGNTLCISGQLYSAVPSEAKLYVLTLDCEIIDNILSVKSYEYRDLPEINVNASGYPYALHGQRLHRNFWYLATRTSSDYTISETQFLKINPFDLTDIKIKELDINGSFNGSTGTIQTYDDKIYCMLQETTTDGIKFLQLDENLENPEILFTAGDELGQERIRRNGVFVIYNDQVFIPFVSNTSPSAYQNIGMFKFDLLKRTLTQKITHVIAPGAGAIDGQPYPHWISEFNGHIIFHTSGNNSAKAALVSINSNDLSLEGYGELDIVGNITNDNTIDKDGYIYLNPEDAGNYLLKVKYNSIPAIIDATYADSPIDYYSLGTPERRVSKNSLKTKLSEFENDENFSPELSVEGFYYFDGTNTISLSGPSSGYLKANGLIGGFPAEVRNSNISTDPGDNSPILNTDNFQEAIWKAQNQINTLTLPSAGYYFFDGVNAVPKLGVAGQMLLGDGNLSYIDTQVRQIAIGTKVGVDEPLGFFTKFDQGMYNLEAQINAVRNANPNLVLISQKSDFPDPVANVITLEDNKTYEILTTVDLLGDRLVSGQNTTILGASSENCILTSTGLGVGVALLTSSYTCPIRHISFKDVDTALDFDGFGNTMALDWVGINFVNVPNIGTIKDADNFIFSRGASLNSQGLIFDGMIGTIGLDNSLFQGSGLVGNIIQVLPTCVITRRFRMDTSALIAFGSTVGIDFSPLTTVFNESYILDTVNFSGGGTYLAGVMEDDNKTLFTRCNGINNSAEIGSYHMINNATATTIVATTTPIKVLGTTTASTLNQKFTHIDNRLTYVGSIQRNFKISCTSSCESSNNNQIGFYIAKNGVILNESVINITTSGTGKSENKTIQALVLLQENDYIELFVENNTGTNDVTVTNLNLIIN